MQIICICFILFAPVHIISRGCIKGAYNTQTRTVVAKSQDKNKFVTRIRKRFWRKINNWRMNVTKERRFSSSFSVSVIIKIIKFVDANKISLKFNICASKKLKRILRLLVRLQLQSLLCLMTLLELISSIILG